MEDIRSKYDLIAAIAAVGALIAMVGAVLAYMDFPLQFNVISILIYVLALAAGVLAVMPKTSMSSRLVSIILGFIMIFDSFLSYMSILESMTNVSDVGFLDVGLGIWLVIAGSVIFTIFMIADYVTLKKEN